MTDRILKIKDLRKCFPTAHGDVQAVDGVSFELAQKEFVALHGPSGCGKSTLLLIAGGLLSPDEGLVTIASQNPYTLDANGRAAFRAGHVGFVFQQFHLIPFLNVLDNVLVGELARPSNGDSNGKTAAPDFRERALELLESFGLTARLHHVPSTLSVGEQQRVALARALVRRPALILADEPTGNLDPANAATILEHLSDFASQGGAVLMVTHEEAARAAANRSLELVAGKLTTSL